LIEPLLEEYPYIFDRGTNLDDDPYSFDRFIKISTLISSRAFEVDAFHENALVPFADIFNHKGEGEHVHFETEFEVCDACGALEYCEHQYLDFLENSDDEHEGDDEDGEGEWEDAGDVHEDISEAEDEDGEEMGLDTELPDLEELEEAGVNFWDSEEDEDKKDTCDMVLDRDVKKGEEVFNTYGEHPNIALLSKYGFCYDDNKNDYVSIGEDSVVDCCLAISAELLKSEMPKASADEVEKLAVERTGPRWEFFLKNEQTLCPTEDGEEEGQDDFENGCQDDCCASDDEGHGHEGHESHSHGHAHDDDDDDDDEEHDEEDHKHDEDGGCCGGEEDESKGRPYYINYEGLFEDKVMCLLHIMFIPEAKFATFVEDIDNALAYFEDLANSQGENKTKAVVAVKRNIYQVCRALAEFRRLEYLEDGEWKSIEQEIEERKKVRIHIGIIKENNKIAYMMLCILDRR
jgi:hypothetical protein